MSFDNCLTLLQLQDKLPVDVIRETAREYEAEGVKPGEAMMRAVTEHLDEAKRQEAHIVATVKDKFTASGGKLPEPAAAPVEPKDGQGEGVRNSVSGDQTDTPAFKRWFGASRVVDKDGKPLVVYHGTNADVSELKSKGELYPDLPWTRGIYFTADPAYASRYAEGDGANVMPVYLKMENPKIVTDSGFKTASISREQINQLRADGHDGIINHADDEYIVFDSKQVKSATGNSGAFDPASPDIRYSTKGEHDYAKEIKDLEHEADGLLGPYSNDAELSKALSRLTPEQRARLDEIDAETARLREEQRKAKKKPNARPNDDRLQATYDSPEEVPADVRAWVRRNASTLFTDASDAVRWSRIENTLDHERYPEGELTIYRAVAEGDEIRPGDWVTTDRSYAEGHMEKSLNGRGRILEEVVDGADVLVSPTGNHEEAIYAPRDLSGPVEDTPRYSAGFPHQRELSAFPLAREPLRAVSSLVQALADQGAIVLHADASTLPVKGKLPAGVQALTDRDGTIHVVANALGDNATGIILHEAFHAGGEALVGSKAWNGLTRRLGNLYALSEKGGGTARAFFDAARERVETAKAKGAVGKGMEAEEFGAYAIEEYAKAPLSIRKWVDDLLGHVKAWALARFGKQLGEVTPAQLSSLAKLALLDVQAARSASPDLQPAFSDNGEKTIEVDGQRRPIENASGKLIAPDMHQQMAFWRWAGDTKAVDDQGRPIVVYHGTQESFDKFSGKHAGKAKGNVYKGKSNFFFARAPELASDYAKAQDYEMEYYGAQPNVMPVYLAMQDPLIVDAKGMGYGAVTEDAINQARKEKRDGVIIRNVLDRAGEFADPTDVFIAFTAEQIKSATGNDGSFSGDTPDIRYSVAGAAPAATWSAPAPTMRDTIVHVLQDKHVDMKRVVSEIRAHVGQLDDKWDPYLQEELFHGRSATGFKSFLHDELRPLLADMKLRGVSMVEFEEYLHNRTAKETNDQIAAINPEMPDGGSGIDTQDALDYLANLPPAKARAYEALAARVDAITGETQRLLVDYGLEKQSTIDAWNATYQHYVPLMREDMDSPLKGNGTGSGFSIRGPSSKRRTGSKRAVVDILANVAMARERAIVRGEKNRLDLALYGLSLQAPNPEFWKPVNPQKNPAALVSELVNMGLSPTAAQAIVDEPKQKVIDPQTGMVVYRTNPLLRSAPNVVAVRVGGEDRFIFFNERSERAMRMAMTLKNMGNDQVGWFLGAAAHVTRAFASINTQYNPVFGMVNIIRDTGEGMVNLSSTPLAGQQPQFVAETARLFALVARKGFRLEGLSGADAALWAEFQREGGITGFRAMFNDSADRAKELQKELDPNAWMTSKWGKVFTAAGKLKVPYSVARKVSAPLFDWLSDYNEALENITRMAVYKLGKEHGLTAQQAASVAKNATLNFNRRGAVGSQVGSLYAFFNAAVQGQARMLQTLSGPAGKKIIGGGLLLGVLQAVMMAAAGFDDEEPPEFVKAHNIVIPLGWVSGKKNYLTVPMPLGFSFIPTIGRIGAEFAIGGGKKLGKHTGKMFEALLDAFNPLGSSTPLQTLTPTAVDPLAALAENRDWSGKPIYREDMSGLHPTPGFSRTKDTASGVSKVMAQYLNTWSGGTKYTPGALSPTPDQIDYLLGQFTGGVGREALKVQQTVSSTLSGEELPAYKVPLGGRFYGNNEGQSSVSGKFYENLKDLNVLGDELEGRAKDHANPRAYLLEHPEAKLADLGQSIQRDIAALRKKKHDLLEKGDKERVKETEAKIGKLMAKFNERVKLEKSKAAAQ